MELSRAAISSFEKLLESYRPLRCTLMEQVTVIEQFILGVTRYSDGWRRVRASKRVSAHQNTLCVCISLPISVSLFLSLQARIQGKAYVPAP